MLEIFPLIKLNFAIIFAFFVPGWLLLSYFFKKNAFSPLERIVLSLGLSLFIINFFFILLDKLNWSFSNGVIFFLFLNLISYLIFLKIKKGSSLEKPPSEKLTPIFWLILFTATIFRVFYLSDKVIPSSTDLGHHMYWSKSIIETDKLPFYGMPDFIIGEHIIFALIGFLSGWSLISAWPMAILFAINIFSLLAFFLLARQIFPEKNSQENQNLANLALLVGGALYTFSSPQASFVSGGVIGNLLGNFFLPLIFWLALSALKKQSPGRMVLAILLSATLAYTHHLSTYVFLFSLLFVFGFLLINDFLTRIKNQKNYLLFSQNFRQLFFNRKVVIAIFSFIGFIFLIQPPSYLNKSAIDTAIGTPSKATRTGYSLPLLAETLGNWRFFFALVGLVIILLLIISVFSSQTTSQFIKEKLGLNIAWKNNLWPLWLVLAWNISLFLLSWAPEWLKTDIPSRRLVSYLTWPASLLSALGLFFLFTWTSTFLQKKSLFWLFFVFLAAGFFSSNSESQTYLLSSTNNSEAYQTFTAAQYLAEKSAPQEQILKDHIYLKGDTWIKLFLMRGYNEPLSRSNLSRYDDPVKPRETCTRDIIANPDNFIGQKCLQETKVKYVLLRKGRDDQNFKKSSRWSKIFSNSTALIFTLNDRYVQN